MEAPRVYKLKERGLGLGDGMMIGFYFNIGVVL